jgi:hypothetical protein
MSATLFDWKASRDAAMAQVERNAGESFAERASAHILADLAQRGPTSCEILTDRCKLDGIKPHDDRAFGPVYMSLMRQGKIEKCGTVIRTKGHGTSGGNVWKLTTK